MKNIENEIITSLKNLLEEKQRNIVIVTHENPDGDAIGSAIGLAEVLCNAGHEAIVISPNDYPSFLKWFASNVEILIYDHKKKKVKNIMARSDILICLDFNEPERAGNIKKQLLLFPKPKIVIDHHPDPADFADYLFSDMKYSSTAELVFDILKKINFKKFINQSAAEAFFTGIMTDTGSFSYGISSPNVFKVVSELLSWKINTEKIHSAIYNNFSENRMKLLGYCLNKKMEILPEFRSAVISISRRELEEYKFQPGDTEGFVNFPLSVENIIFSALFIEKKDIIKASFRSKGNFPANTFSRDNFNGGGHLNAAGGESKLTLSETVEKFKQLLKDYKHLLSETKI